MPLTVFDNKATAEEDVRRALRTWSHSRRGWHFTQQELVEQDRRLGEIHQEQVEQATCEDEEEEEWVDMLGDLLDDLPDQPRTYRTAAIHVTSTVQKEPDADKNDETGAATEQPSVGTQASDKEATQKVPHVPTQQKTSKPKTAPNEPDGLIRTGKKIYRPKLVSEYIAPDLGPDLLDGQELLFKDYGKSLRKQWPSSHQETTS